MLFLDQPSRRDNADRRVSGIVAIKRLDRAAEDTAGLIDPLQCEFDAILLALPAIGERSAENGGHANAHGVGGASRLGSDQTSDQESGFQHRQGLPFAAPDTVAPRTPEPCERS